MTWEQQFAAMKALCGIGDCALHMRSPGEWYVSLRGVEVKDGAVLRGAGSSGKSPEEAVMQTWSNIATNLPSDRYLVIGAMRDDRRAVRWNGFMWEDVAE